MEREEVTEMGSTQNWEVPKQRIWISKSMILIM